MHTWYVVVVAIVSLGTVAAALSVLYSRMLPVGSWVPSFGVSAACATIGATVWFVGVGVFVPAAVGPLYVPAGMLAAVAVTVASLALRASNPPLGAVLLFAFAWSALVVVPVAISTFVTGVAGIMPVDHAGSLVVNVAGGAAALGILLVRRRGAESPALSVESWMLAVGVVVLAAGWLVWLGAAELAFDDAAVAAVGNGLLGGLGGVGGWLLVQRLRHQSTSLAAVAAGLISGLVAVSAGAPMLSAVSSVSIGVLSSAAGAWFTLRRVSESARQQWFLPGTHLVAGAIGFVLVGLVADDYGFLFTGQLGFVQDQFVSALVVTVYSFAVSFVLWWVLSFVASRRRLATLA